MMVFLDDVRESKDCVTYMHQRIGDKNPIHLKEWIIAKNYDEFVDIVSENFDTITHVSFDHDLANEHYISDQPSDMYLEKTGLDCAKWLKEFYEKNDTTLPIMFIHSMNPIGTQRIINEFNSK